MNSLPTPECSPAGHSGKWDAKKLKNAESEKKLSKKVRKRDSRSSKSLPGLNRSSKNEKKTRPKSLFPKVALIISPKNAKSSKASKSPKNLQSPKIEPKKSHKGPKAPTTPKTPTKNNEVTTPNGMFIKTEVKKEKDEEMKKQLGKSPSKKAKLNRDVNPLEEIKKEANSKVSFPPKTIKLNGEATPVKETRKEPNAKVKSPSKKIKLNGMLTPVEENKKKLVEETKKKPVEESKKPVEESKKPNEESRKPVEETKKKPAESLREKVEIEWQYGIKWSLGQLAWARVGNFPYWPCVVTLEPESMLFTKTQVRGTSFIKLIHVQYFGDNERHSWISEFNILPFYGADDFEKRAAKFMGSVYGGRRGGPSKLRAAFIVQASQRSRWETAISEATEIFGISNEDRASMFAPAPPVMNIKTQSPSKRKRKLSSGDFNSEVPSKRSKSNALPNSRKSNSKSRKSKDSKSNLSPNKKNSKMNKSTGDLSKISEKVVKLNGKFSKSTGNLSKLFEKTPKLNGKLGKDSEKSHKINGKLHKSLKNCKVEIYDSLVQTPPTPPSSLLSNSWDDEKKNSTFDILMALGQPGIEGEIKKERWSDSAQENGEDFSNRSTSSDLDDDSSEDFEPMNSRKFEKKKNKSGKEGSSGKGKMRMRPLNLFKGIKQERVCQICEQIGKLVRCKGPCFSYYHLSCVKPGESPENSEVEDNLEDELFQDLKEIRAKIAENESFSEKPEAVIKVEDPPEEETFKCIDCLSGVAPACFICNDREIERERCSAVACGRYYHPTCLKTWPQSHWQGGRLTCPYHMCHTCNSDNPQNGHVGKTNEKLARCVRCPSSYHASTSCLPAGSEIITGNQIICPKHYKCNQPPINATWCFLCTKGGSLICCDTCPTSFHPECLGIKAPDGAYICEDCETGRLPLYGEVVWVKLGSYRWWPSRICFPYEIPLNVEALNHRVGEFCVMFLGTRNYHWVHRGRAFLYQEGDACTKPTGKKTVMDENFKRALDEANEYHQLLKKQRAAAKDQERGLKPPPYVKLKVNKPVGNVKAIEVESIVACICSPDKDNPCAPDTDCLNRMLCVECSPEICPAGSKCQNQAFVQRLYPAMEAFHTDGKGWGLRNLEAIKAGQFVIEYVGEIIDEAEYKRRLHRKKELKNENYYFLTIDTGRMIDAEPKGNLSRFMNHSCQPNCETQKWTVNGDTRIGLFAVKDIEPGEELTFNYNLACDGEKRKPCLCGAPNCSGFIGLKVQKQQISAIQERKPEKTEKPKRQKRARKVICWSCRKEVTGEDPIKCDQKACGKKYHKRCVVLKNSETKFTCPWHHCSQCGRKTSSHCYICKLAFCQVHLNKNLTESKKGLVCKSHQGLLISDSSMEDVKDMKETMDKLNLDIGKRPFSPFGNSSPILSSKSLTKREDQSSRVSIVEVQLSSEENDDCLTEDTDDPDDSANLKETSPRRRSSRRGKRRFEELNTLNSEQLLVIIGGGV